MKLSTKGRYGIRALVDIAVHQGEEGETISLRSIAERQQISEGYLEQLMAKLKRGGFVKSLRGSKGGYVLAKPAEKICVGDALRTLEGDIYPVDCVGEDGCQIFDKCVTKYLWKRINEGVNKVLDDITLQELMDESHQAHA